MEKTNRTSNLRVIFSALALIGFILFVLYKNFVVNEYTAYHTYGWRLEVLKDLFVGVPFVALFMFSIMECRMKYINGRVFVVGIFVICSIQIFIFLNETIKFSVFCCDLLQTEWEIIIINFIGKAIILSLLPIGHKIMLRIYSSGMSLLLGYVLVKYLIRENFVTAETLIALSVDILFYIALFFFSDLLKEENQFNLGTRIFRSLMYPIFGDIFEDNEDDDDDDDFDKDEPEESKVIDYAVEYKKILIHAMNEEDNTFLGVHSFFWDLSKDIVSSRENQYYSVEEYVKNLTLLSQKISEINSIKSGFISKEVVRFIHSLLKKKDEENFRAEVIILAKLLNNERMIMWVKAAKQYTKFDTSHS